ncbi:MAG: response regulator [Cyclobacteriaceae bacterium]
MEKIGITYIIDDDPLYNFGTKKLMEFSDFTKEAFYFLNGELAWNDLQHRIQEKLPLPDVILLDINMPIMNGWQFLDMISQVELPESIKIYVVSSSINQEEVDKANAYGIVTDYITKPLTLEKIKTLKMEILKQD